MESVSAWRRAGSYLVANWVPWLILLLATTALGFAAEPLVRPTLPPASGIMPFGAQAALAQSMAAAAALATVAPLALVIGSFMAAAEFSLLKSAADSGAVPSLASYFRGGWEWWSWTWRGIGFGIVFGLALNVASLIVGLAATTIPVLGAVIAIALVLAWFLVAIPVGVWGWVAGFYFRPVPYWASLRRAWDTFRLHPGPMLGPVYATLGVAFVVFTPTLSPSYLAMRSTLMHAAGPQVPVYGPTPALFMASLVVGAFELWALLTILLRVRDWGDGQSVQPTADDEAGPHIAR